MEFISSILVGLREHLQCRGFYHQVFGFSCRLSLKPIQQDIHHDFFTLLPRKWGLSGAYLGPVGLKSAKDGTEKNDNNHGAQQPDKDRKVSYQHFTKASGSWLELLQLQQGEGQAWVQHCDFSLEPPPTSWAFWSGVVDGHGLKSCQVSTQSVFSISKSHVSRLIWTLAFVHPPLGLKFVGFEWIRLFHMFWGFYFYKAFESAFGGPLNSLHILLHTSAHLRILCTGELDFGSACRE